MTRQTRVNARLNAKTAAKVARLRKATGQTTSEIITRAIDHLHDELLAHDAQSALATFIGCGEAEPTLSRDYKLAFTTSLNAKHDHR